MLSVTENAVELIVNLTQREQVPEGAGLRIATDHSAGSLTLSLAPEPEPGDQVIDASGARLFLDSEAAVQLDHTSLDAAVDPEGSVQFRVINPNSQ